MFSVWNATASMSRPGASVVALVNGNPVASAYGLTATCGPVQTGGNDQISFQIIGDTPGASVTVTIQGYQATDIGDLPQLGATGNATVVNIQPQDGATVFTTGDGFTPQTQPNNFASGLLDVSQWSAVQLAISPTGVQQVGVTLEWFLDPLTQVAGWSTMLVLPGAPGIPNFPYVGVILPNRGPLVQLAANAITGGPSFTWAAVLTQTNRSPGVNPYSVQAPYLCQDNGFSLANGNTQNIPLESLYSGPAAVRLQVPAGPTQLVLQALDGAGNFQSVWTQNGLTTTQQYELVIPNVSCRFQVTNNSGATQTYSLQSYITPTGSS
jgi:hypothetical protein